MEPEVTTIVLTIVIKSSCTHDLSFVADSIANNIIYNDTYDTDGCKRDDNVVEEVSWELK